MSHVTDTTSSVINTTFRVTDGLIAYYPFDEGSGPVARDQSDNGSAMDLTLTAAGHEPE